ncbi:MAG: sialidase family protein [Candidatus Obscuribacterales bacterium]|nr:sialidase family protein [Candidatus Obscuribacterales bacterium]
MKGSFSAVLMALCISLSAHSAERRPTDALELAKGSRPAIATDGSSRLYAVFEGCDGDKKVSDIFCSSSIDCGATWSARQNISKMQSASERAAVAVEKSGAIDVVWSSNGADLKSSDIFFVRSTDGAKTWSEPINISNTAGPSVEPAIATGPDDSIHVVFTDTSTADYNKDILYVRSKDGDKQSSKIAFLSPVDISNTPGASTEPDLVVTPEGVVRAVWIDTTSGETHPDVYSARREHDSWTEAVDVSRSARVSTHPSLAYDKERVFLTWSDNSRKETAADIWVDIGSRRGKFSKPINISDTPGWSNEPRATANNGQLVIVWTDTSTGTLTPSIYARVTPDVGQDFTAVMNMSQRQGMSKHPSVTITGGKMIVVWEEIVGDDSTIEVTTLKLKDLPTGPPLAVDPTLHGVSGNMH